MAILTQRYNLDVVAGGAPLVVNVHQNDSTQRVIEFALYSSNGDLEIPNGSTASVEGLKPDGTAYAFAANIHEGVVSVAVQAQMVVLAGDIESQVKVIAGGLAIYAANFILRVQKDVTGDADVSETEIPSLVAQAQAAAEAAAAAALTIDSSWFINGANNIYLDNVEAGDGTVVGALNDLLPMRGEGTYSDFDMYLKYGCYYINPAVTTLNNPSENESGLLEVCQPVKTASYVMQRYTTTYYGAVYTRIYASNAWSRWVQIHGGMSSTYALNGQLQSGSLNSVLTAGIHRLDSSETYTGLPEDISSVDEGMLLEVVIAAAVSNIVEQRLFSLHNGKTYTRYTINGGSSWVEWRELGGGGSGGYGLNGVAPAGSLNAVLDAGVWALSSENTYTQLPYGLSANPECILEVIKAGESANTIEQRLFTLENNKTYTRRTANGGTSWTTWLELGKVEVDAISDTSSEYAYKGIRVKARKYGNVVQINIFGTASENLGGMMSYLNLCELPEGWSSILDPQQNHLINVSGAIWGTVSVFGRTVRLGWFRKLDSGTWAQTNVEQGTQLITSLCYICSS